MSSSEQPKTPADVHDALGGSKTPQSSKNNLPHLRPMPFPAKKPDDSPAPTKPVHNIVKHHPMPQPSVAAPVRPVAPQPAPPTNMPKQRPVDYSRARGMPDVSAPDSNTDKILAFLKRHRPLIIILIIDVVIFLPMLLGKGEMLFRDFHFPLRQSSFQHFHFPFYNDMIENNNLSSWYRLPSRLPFIALSHVMTVAAVLKIYLFSSIVLGQICFYAFARRVLRIQHSWILGSTAFFYTFNHRFFDFLWETSLVWAYALLPLGLLLLTGAVHEKRLFNKYSLLFPLFFVMIFVHPYALVATCGIMTFWVLFVIKDVKLWPKIRTLALFAIGGICVSIYFLLPVASVWAKQGPVDPTSAGVYEFDRKIIDFLSSSTLADKLTMTRSPIRFIDYAPTVAMFRSIWFEFAMLVYSVIPLLLLTEWFRRKKRSTTKKFDKSRLSLLPVVILYIVLLIMSFGTIGPQGPLYKLLVDVVPSSFEWLVRSPLKIPLYATSLLIIMYAMLLDNLLYHYSRKVCRVLIATFIVAMLFICFFTYKSYFWEDRLTPVKLPQAYYDIDHILETKKDNHRVLFLPRYAEIESEWSGNRGISPFDMISSPAPTISYWWNDLDYATYLNDELYNTRKFDNICTYLRPLNIEYLVFHNDRLGYRNLIDSISLDMLKEHYSKNIVYAKDNWYLFDLNCADQKFFSLKPNIASTQNINEDVQLSKTFNALDKANPDNSFLTKDTILNQHLKTVTADRKSQAVWANTTSFDLYKTLAKHIPESELSDISKKPTTRKKAADSYVATDPIAANASTQATAKRVDATFVSHNSLVKQTRSENTYTIPASGQEYAYFAIEYKATLSSENNTAHVATVAYDMDLKNVQGLHINYQLYKRGRAVYDKQVVLEDLSESNEVPLTEEQNAKSPRIYIPEGVDRMTIYVKGLSGSNVGRLQVKSLAAELVKSEAPQDNPKLVLPNTKNSIVYLKALNDPNGGYLRYNSDSGGRLINFSSDQSSVEWLKLIPKAGEDLQLEYVNGQNIIMGYSLEQDARSSAGHDYIALDGTCDLFEKGRQRIVLRKPYYLCRADQNVDAQSSEQLLQYFKNPEVYSRVDHIKNYYQYSFTKGQGAPSERFGIVLPLVGAKFVSDKLDKTSYLASVYSRSNYEPDKRFDMPINKIAVAGIIASLSFMLSYVVFVKFMISHNRVKSPK